MKKALGWIGTDGFVAFAMAVMSAPSVAYAQASVAACELNDHPSKYLGKEISVRGRVVDGAPHGFWLVGNGPNGEETCVVEFGKMADGQSAMDGIFEPAAKVAGTFLSWRTVWVTLTGTYSKQRSPPPGAMAYRAADIRDRYVIDKISAQDFEAGPYESWVPHNADGPLWQPNPPDAH